MTLASRLLLAPAILLVNIPAFAQSASGSRSISITDVPEPGTIPLVLLGIAGALAVSRYVKRGKDKNKDKRK